MLLMAIAMLVRTLQGFAVNLAGQRRRDDLHWQRNLSFVRIGLKWLKPQVINGYQEIMACNRSHHVSWSHASQALLCSVARSSRGSRGLSFRYAHDIPLCWRSHICHG